MEEKQDNSAGSTGLAEDFHGSGDDVIGGEASPIQSGDTGDRESAADATGPRLKPQPRQGETADGAGADETPGGASEPMDDEERWLAKATELIDQVRLDPGSEDRARADALREEGDYYLAATLVKSEDLLSQVIAMYRSRNSFDASAHWTTPSWCLETEEGEQVLVHPHVDVAVTELVRLSRPVRCEAERRIAIKSPAVEVFQGVTFKWRIAAILAHLSQLTYEISDWADEEQKQLTAKKCRGWIADDNLTVQYFRSSEAKSREDNAAILVESASDVYIVFRGTVSWTNWRQNARLRYKSFNIFSNADAPQSEVHHGFFDAQDSLWPHLQELEIFGRTNGENQQGRNVWIGGHSLAGAMAIITAARLVTQLGVKRIDGVYTFGSPSLFNSAAASQYRAHPMLMGRTFRVKFDLDIVPRVLSISLRNPGIPIRVTERDGMSERMRHTHDPFRFTSLSFPLGRRIASDDVTLGTRQHIMKNSYLKKLDILAREAGAGIACSLTSEWRRERSGISEYD